MNSNNPTAFVTLAPRHGVAEFTLREYRPASGDGPLPVALIVGVLPAAMVLERAAYLAEQIEVSSNLIAELCKAYGIGRDSWPAHAVERIKAQDDRLSSAMERVDRARPYTATPVAHLWAFNDDEVEPLLLALEKTCTEAGWDDLRYSIVPASTSCLA